MFQLFENRKNKISLKSQKKFLIKNSYKLNNNSYISSSFCYFFYCVNFFNFMWKKKNEFKIFLENFSWLFYKGKSWRSEFFFPIINNKIKNFSPSLHAKVIMTTMILLFVQLTYIILIKIAAKYHIEIPNLNLQKF